MVVQFCVTKSIHDAEKSVIVQNANYEAEKYVFSSEKKTFYNILKLILIYCLDRQQNININKCIY